MPTCSPCVGMSSATLSRRAWWWRLAIGHGRVTGRTWVQCRRPTGSTAPAGTATCWAIRRQAHKTGAGQPADTPRWCPNPTPTMHLFGRMRCAPRSFWGTTPLSSECSRWLGRNACQTSKSRKRSATTCVPGRTAWRNAATEATRCTCPTGSAGSR